MTKFNKRPMGLCKNQKGLTTVEYAIAGGLIAGGVILAFGLLGTNVAGVVNAIANALGPIAAAI